MIFTRPIKYIVIITILSLMALIYLFLGLKVSLILVISLILWLILGFIAIAIKMALKNKRVIDDKSSIREYFDNFDSNNPMGIIDATPRYIEIGLEKKKVLCVKPLRGKQVARLCVMFAKTLDKLKGNNLTFEDTGMLLSQVIEACEDDFFMALAYVLFYSQRDNTNVDDMDEMLGVKEMHSLLMDAPMTQLADLLSIIMIQNDIRRTIDNFSMLSDRLKKKA